MKVILLITKNHRPISMAALLDVFQTVNSFYLLGGKEEFFSISLASHENLPPINGYPVVSLASISNCDLVLIPAFNSGDIGAFLSDNVAIVPWLQQQYIKGAHIASFCTGACLLAMTGLLDGRRATTHVQAVSQFKEYFPAVLLEEDKVMTEDNRVYTSGGATCSFHLMLYLIEKFCGRNTAIKASKFFSVDMDRNSQSHFAIFTPARQHDDKIVIKAQERMETSYSEINTIDEFINDLPVSRRNFIRRFKGATGLTPISYLQNIRIEAAKKSLETTQHSIMEVMLEVGYSDIKAFRKIFKRIVGLTPSAYQEKFRAKQKKVLSINKKALPA